MIIPGEFGGSLGTDLLFYDAHNGIARFYATTGDGNITFLKQHSWQEWDMIIPGNWGGSSHTDLLFYSRTRGQAKFYRTDGNGNISFLKEYGFQKTWDQIVPGEFGGSGSTDLFFYRRVIGDGKFYSLDADANLTLLTSYKGLRTTWDLIVPNWFDSTPHTDLLFYDRTAGEARVVIVNPGTMSFQPVVKTEKSWGRIVPGIFDAKNALDLLCYDFTHRLRIHAVKCTDANGSRAAAISPSQVRAWVDRANVVYAAAGIQFDFDPETDYQVIANDMLNSLDTCTHFATQPECDAPKALARAIASTYPCKIVVFFRYGNRANATGGGFSNPNDNFVAMPGFSSTATTRYYQDPNHPQHGAPVQNIKLLAHELGHYLGMAHTFVGVDYTGFTDPHVAVVAYMTQNNKRTLDEIDGDRHVVYDTPSDVGIDYTDRILTSGATTSSAGSAAFPVPIPNSTAVIGSLFYTQCVSVDPGANAAGLTVTNALETRIGG